MIRTFLCMLLCPVVFEVAHGQYWQQRVEYTMSVELNVETHQYHGNQYLVYYNNSPDTLNKLFYHLYYNAFQPGSSMVKHEQDMIDPDGRVQGIAKYREGEEGYLHVARLTQDGSPADIIENETILEVTCHSPIYPGDTTVLELEFSGHVPVLTRRAGRDNSEGIDYSMGQWYPKLCTYDQDGWHPNPYISREFYGDFGDFNVSISIDSRYTVAATGVLQNPEETLHGYQAGGEMLKPDVSVTTWRFKAEDVHDFVWAADPEYSHTILHRNDGVPLHFFFRRTNLNEAAWAELPEIMDFAMSYMNERFGQYPYPTYSFIQAGDYGMEYPMATLVEGNRRIGGLASTCIHELIHSWYHAVLGTNESLYPWMDEGFTEYAEAMVTEALAYEGYMSYQLINDQPGAYNGYYQLAGFGIEEPLSTHADHYFTNTGYVYAAYFKGAVFLNQLEYIIGAEAMSRTMLRYFETWKFKHPGPLDFLRIAELESGMVLDWYYEYWVLSVKQIDYEVVNVTSERRHSTIHLRRAGRVPMPVEVEIRLTDGDSEIYYIPLELMRGEKPPRSDLNWSLLDDWHWALREYSFTVPHRISRIQEVIIDPFRGLADVKPENNKFSPPRN